MISRPHHCIPASRCNSVGPACNSYALSLSSIINHQTSIIGTQTTPIQQSFRITRLNRIHFMISRSNHCIPASRCNSVGPACNSYAFSALSIINHRSSAHYLKSYLSVSRLNRIYFMISRPHHCIPASHCNSVGPAYNSYALSLLSIINHQSSIIGTQTTPIQQSFRITRLNRIHFMISRPHLCIPASRCNSVGPACNSYAFSALSIINHRSSAHKLRQYSNLSVSHA